MRVERRVANVIDNTCNRDLLSFPYFQDIVILTWIIGQQCSTTAMFRISRLKNDRVCFMVSLRTNVLHGVVGFLHLQNSGISDFDQIDAIVSALQSKKCDL